MLSKKIQKTNKIYINHLNNYPESKYGSVIGDDLEGQASKNINLNSYVFHSKDRNTALGKEVSHFFNFEGVENFQITGGQLVLKEKDDNCYVYCLCQEYDDYVKKEFGESCLIIEDFPSFLNELNKSMSKRRSLYLLLINVCI